MAAGERGAAAPLDAGRRRFTAGVLLTLASQPGMAAEICTTPSGSLSGGLQSHHGPAQSCAGAGPGYWKNHGGWPAGCAPDTRFGQVFSVGPQYAGTYGAATCMAMLSHQPFDKANLGMHLVASYLNVLSGRISFITADTLSTMWNQWQARGYYTPADGVQWNEADIVVYLSGTMD